MFESYLYTKDLPRSRSPTYYTRLCLDYSGVLLQLRYMSSRFHTLDTGTNTVVLDFDYLHVPYVRVLGLIPQRKDNHLWFISQINRRSSVSNLLLSPQSGGPCV